MYGEIKLYLIFEKTKSLIKKKVMKKSLWSVITFLFLSLSISTYAAYPLDEATATTVTTTNGTTTSTSVASVSAKKALKKELATAAKANNAGGKSKIAAALLAFFLGSFGVHSFYMGQKKKGFIQLGLTILGIVLMVVGIGAAVTDVATGGTTTATTAIIGYLLVLGVSIWAFVDFIRILIGGLAPEEGFND